MNSDLDQFHGSVDSVTTPCHVGGDTAEDVFGGLDAVLKLKWPSDGTKVSYSHTINSMTNILTWKREY